MAHRKTRKTPDPISNSGKSSSKDSAAASKQLNSSRIPEDSTDDATGRSMKDQPAGKAFSAKVSLGSTVSEGPESQLSQLLSELNKLFLTHGLRKVTMDFAAAELSVSKKTLYKYFDNRSDMIARALHWHIENESCQVEEIREGAENAIDEMLQVARLVIDQLAQMNPDAVHEARQYYPEAWSFIEDYHKRYVRQTIESNLKAGIEQGLYRAGLNAEIMSRLYVGRMDVFFDQEYFPSNRFKLTEVYREFMNYHIRGIASREGVAYLESRLNQTINEKSKRA